MSISTLLLLISSWILATNAEHKYQEQISAVIYDRHETPISIKENTKNHYVYQIDFLPSPFINLLLHKEDRFFYYHPGINPISSLRALYIFVTTGKSGGSSTLTQQLAKNLLGTESNRTVMNKIVEALYALSIELYYSKAEVLQMYANTVYLGNQVQGFETASQAYFAVPLSETTVSQQLGLLATLSHPSTRNPWMEDNQLYAAGLQRTLLTDGEYATPEVTSQFSFQRDSFFELRTAGVECTKTCQTTIDNSLTNDLREILKRHIDTSRPRNVRNGAVVVINPQTTELLAFIGSPDPTSQTSGNQINMAISPRPIGSTIKPFIYAEGFAAGLRPYSLVEDREYKYPIATGFSLYPKNYDGQYRGEVTLHEALSNSLNVPTVKVLEYVGLESFYRFLLDDLQFQPIQDLDSYQYGIALGGLEMDLLTLTHFFTLFPQHGILSPLQILQDRSNNFDLPPQSTINATEQIIDEGYVELVQAIISDRLAGVNQFGLKSNLNLNSKNYTVKTGTSRDFHDSWVVGYTPDFVVGVWLGNVENEPLEQVSGQTGAGAVWHDVMEYLLASDYSTDQTFSYTHLERMTIENSDEWGLRGDPVAAHRELLLGSNLILTPHTDDTFILTPNISIPLRSRTEATWTANGQLMGTGTEVSFSPTKIGSYELHAATDTQSEYLQVHITQPE